MPSPFHAHADRVKRPAATAAGRPPAEAEPSAEAEEETPPKAPRKSTRKKSTT